MNTCDSCGNSYDKAFQITVGGTTYNFDCFECAIHKLAPVCAHCGNRIIGHGIEASGKFYCCAHCSKQQGIQGAIDRVA
ncbi:hypothetical protein SOCEGT47_044820 [Sorangium cellulosum]|uniref:Metallothionein n=1 Tax=Sorangium cellulosum TaxID=56 RepID=A0A4P2Q462_SORCE|nr:hypothetical protein [Sorangium cellulosum]AUX23951.1 hypothetical protein SOCEGT47_044820 [Sorangium cellulosum]